MQQKGRAIAVVAYEDRAYHEIGVKLLVSSLEVHFSEADVHVFATQATDNLQCWMGNHPTKLHLSAPTDAQGWNVKPDLLLWALGQGYSQAIWIDSDIILSSSPPRKLFDRPLDVLVAAELPGLKKLHTHERTIPWGLEPGRSFARNPTGCCLRVTQEHLAFLVHWKTMLQSNEYQYWQARPAKERPIHALGDDSLLIALLGSKGYASLSLELLECGTEIAQCLTSRGYSTLQRLKSLSSGVPPLIHAMGAKPWIVQNRNYVAQTVAPYTCVARSYRKELDESEQDWLRLPEGYLRLWYNFVEGHPALGEIPFSILSELKAVRFRSLIVEGYRRFKEKFSKIS